MPQHLALSHEQGTPIVTTLSALDVLQPAVVTSIACDADLVQRFAALGLFSGQTLSILRKAPFGGPLQVRVGLTDMLLRRKDAAYIGVACI